MCVTLNQPLDHGNTQAASTIDVVFAIKPATGERKGMFVTAVGGPGSAGIGSADSYLGSFPEGIAENFDVVFFDQRGVGESGGLQCVRAAANFYRADWSTQTSEDEARLLEAAKNFSEQCVVEMGHQDWLPYISTSQAVEDLESFRQAMGDEKFWLYGESYGTQFAQTYAERYPQHLAGLILDGTVDLTLNGLDYYREQTQAEADILGNVLDACTADPACADDMGGDARAAYETVKKQVQEKNFMFSFAVAGGGYEGRLMKLSDLESAAGGYLYTEMTRMLFLRALAAAYQGDYSLMARVLYDSLGIDPETQNPTEDKFYSDAEYYAVECNDYNFLTGTAEESGQAFLQAGKEAEKNLPYLSSLFYGDLPCAFWPVGNHQVSNPRPALKAEGVPTLVLAAEADNATPYANSQRVAERLADGYLITKMGGPHILFGRGDECPDEIVRAFLVDGAMPPERKITCPGNLVEAYVPVTKVDGAAYATPMEAMAAVFNAVTYNPQIYYSDMTDPVKIGCTYGGDLSVEYSEGGEKWTLTDCAFSQGITLDGSADNVYEPFKFTLNVKLSGVAEGDLVYTQTLDKETLSGTYGGQAMNLEQ